MVRVKQWRIFQKRRSSGHSCISNSRISIPTCSSDKYLCLNVSKKGNLRRFYKNGYKGRKLNRVLQLMRDIHQNAKNVCPSEQMDMFTTIYEIIPKEFFGTTYHRKLFMKIVKKILTRSTYECILIRSVVRNYNFQKIPWLKGFDQYQHIEYLYHPLEWVLNVVKYLIRKNYHLLKHSYPCEIQLVPHNVWNRFKQRVLNIVLKKNYATPANIPVKEVRGIVTFKPKDGLDKLKFRPILRLHNKLPPRLVKKYVQDINRKAKKTSKTETGPFNSFWERCLRTIGDQKIFCIKVDVCDAYGRVNIDVLCQIINNLDIANSTKQNLISHITNQFVAFKDPTKPKTRTYIWNHGLLQGDHFSGALCNLYMAHSDFIHLSELYKPNNFIHRTMDDYIFVSTDEKDVKKFLKIMKRVHVLKDSKILTNVQISSNSLITEKILYCGLIIDTNTKEITPHFNIRPNTTLHAKFKVWNIANPVNHKNFILKAMRYHFNNYYFRKIFLNKIYNKSETVLDNYFKAMVNLAFKFDVAANAIYNRKEIHVYGEVVGEVVVEYAKIGLRTIRRSWSSSTEDDLKINFAMLVKIGYCAFYVVLRKRFKPYEQIIKEIRKMNNKIHIESPFNVKHYLKLPKEFADIYMARRINILKK